MMRRVAAAVTRPRGSTSTAIVPEYLRVAVRASGGIHFGSGRTTATAGSNATGSLAVTRMGAGGVLATALTAAAGGAGSRTAIGAGSEGGSGAATSDRLVGTMAGGGV